MSWSPDFEESLILQNNMRPTFSQYDEQENHGLTTLRAQSTTLDVNEDVYDDPNDASSVQAKAELQLQAYRRKLGFPVNQSESHEEDVDSEITSVIRNAGLEQEPPSNYRPNSKTTRKSAVVTDRLPVCGTKDLTISLSHFKFDNPYFTSKPKEEENSTEHITSDLRESPEITDKQEVKTATMTASGNDSFYGSMSSETRIGVSGEAYVSPAQLYFMKARRNR